MLVGYIGPGARSLHAQEEQPYAIYLPMVSSNHPPPRSRFGFHLGVYADGRALDLAGDSQPGLARVGDILWSELEPTRGAPYRWDLLAPIEERIAAARSRGIEPIVLVQWAPVWAR